MISHETFEKYLPIGILSIIVIIITVIFLLAFQPNISNQYLIKDYTINFAENITNINITSDNNQYFIIKPDNSIIKISKGQFSQLTSHKNYTFYYTTSATFYNTKSGKWRNITQITDIKEIANSKPSGWTYPQNIYSSSYYPLVYYNATQYSGYNYYISNYGVNLSNSSYGGSGSAGYQYIVVAGGGGGAGYALKGSTNVSSGGSGGAGSVYITHVKYNNT